VPFPAATERFERLEETLQIAHQMWSSDEVRPYEGKYYHLAHPNNAPQAIQKPHPPLLVAGGGERKRKGIVQQSQSSSAIRRGKEREKAMTLSTDMTGGQGRP
jgi:alkanesulfonate monooxygenase SsuD/methylene tetrahydromethanopterin reductase-like flavin-dependent oxidoreductase (luciferase family)